jgi:hypothetical protein
VSATHDTHDTNDTHTITHDTHDTQMTHDTKRGPRLYLAVLIAEELMVLVDPEEAPIAAEQRVVLVHFRHAERRSALRVSVVALRERGCVFCVR